MPTRYSRQTQYVMECIPEPSNRYDALAVLVKVMGTDVTIGRVPKDICNVISVELRISRNLVKSYCLYLGSRHQEGSVPGGGLKLHCLYALEFKNDTPDRRLVEVANYLRRYLPDTYIYL